MKERECEHFVNSIVYLMEQTSKYCYEKGSQFFEEQNMGVSLDQYAAIDTISFNPGICQNDLAKLILKDRSYTSRILNTLEENKYIERKIETKGKRLIKGLYLTDKGKKILSDHHDKLKNLFLVAFSDFSDEEFAALRGGLEKMKVCISKYTIMPL